MTVKKNKPIYEWDEETGLATCILRDGEKSYIGNALCHPEDEDMKNEKTGMIIAQERAELKYLKHIRDNEVKPSLKALKQLYHSIDMNKKFNPKNYEVRAILRHINQYEDELTLVQGAISAKNQKITNLIRDKEDFYQKVRANRTVKNN